MTPHPPSFVRHPLPTGEGCSLLNSMNSIANFFKMQEHGTTFQREILGGITTFLAMSYIIFVQPGVLAVSGMNFQAVLTAT